MTIPALWNHFLKAWCCKSITSVLFLFFSRYNTIGPKRIGYDEKCIKAGEKSRNLFKWHRHVNVTNFHHNIQCITQKSCKIKCDMVSYWVQSNCSVMCNPKKSYYWKLTNNLKSKHIIHIIEVNRIFVKHSYPDEISAEEVKVIRLFLNFRFTVPFAQAPRQLIDFVDDSVGLFCPAYLLSSFGLFCLFIRPIVFLLIRKCYIKI